MVLVIAGLTWVALLVVRQTVQQRARQELTTSAHNSLVIFEILQHQRQMVMSRKADLLATSAFLSNSDASEFTDSTNNPLDTSSSDLMALADPEGKIVALHTTHSGFSAQSVEAFFFDQEPQFRLVVQRWPPVSSGTPADWTTRRHGKRCSISYGCCGTGTR
jgi:hypothetical protein